MFIFLHSPVYYTTGGNRIRACLSRKMTSRHSHFADEKTDARREKQLAQAHMVTSGQVLTAAQAL